MKSKTVFYCTECGNETPKWQGKCLACGSWNTIVEQPAETKIAGKSVSPKSSRDVKVLPKNIKELDSSREIRFSTGLKELDRVLGGGAVTGSLVLVGGAPGIGKSTMLLQVCQHFAKSANVLYVSGEESERQLKMRAERLGVTAGIYVMAETDLLSILETADEFKPDILIADSIQTLYNPELTSAPGSVGQVKDCTMSLMRLAKDSGITVFLIGHINKDGAIAGPKVLEHMVDCVLYFEGERSSSYRILRAAKNRFGSTNEIGVFEMLDKGLREVENPSELLLSGKPENTPGTCVTCVMEGTRPILAEVQALITPSGYNVPRRNANGVDHNRAMMLLAVLEKRGGLRVGACDTYINVVGGLELDEPGADLATVLSIASSYRDKPIGDNVVAIGEVGLTGEIRPVTQLEQRLTEIARLGFKTCIVPYQKKNYTAPEGLSVIRVKTIKDAVSAILI